MSTIAKSAIPPKMYKHFAVITISLTAFLALFADGERKERIVQPIAAAIDKQEDQVRGELRNSFNQAPIDGGMADRIKQPESLSGFGPDIAFGKPMETVQKGGGIIKTASVETNPYSEEYLASLSEGERELLLAGLRDSGMLDPGKKRQQIAALTRSSALRGGSKLGIE